MLQDECIEQILRLLLPAWQLRHMTGEVNAGCCQCFAMPAESCEQEDLVEKVYRGVPTSQAGEASIARSATRDVRALLLLHCLLSECGALIHLAMTDHDSAQGRILLMQGVLTRFPTLLARCALYHPNDNR